MFLYKKGFYKIYKDYNAIASPASFFDNSNEKELFVIFMLRYTNSNLCVFLDNAPSRIQLEVSRGYNFSQLKKNLIVLFSRSMSKNVQLWGNELLRNVNKLEQLCIDKNNNA